MTERFLVFFVSLSLASLVFAFDTGISKVTEVGGKIADAAGKFSPANSCVDVDDSGWKKCPNEIDGLLSTMRSVLSGMGNPMVINTPHEFCEYIQIHNLETIYRSGSCGSRNCTDGKPECFDQTLKVAVKKMKIDCAFHTIESIKKWLSENGLSLPSGIISLGGAEEKKDSSTASPSGDNERYFLHAECTKDCDLNMLLKLNWGANEDPKIEKAGYSTGGFAALSIYWSGDTAAASFLEWLSKAPFMRGFFGVLVQFVLLFVLPGVLKDEKLAPYISTLNCGD